MATSDQISIVTTAFELWRSNRNGRQVPTPTTLRQQAVSLLNHYASSKITSTLRISGSQLKQWKNSLERDDNATQFVQLPMPSPTTQPAIELELRFVSGELMRLSGIVDHDMITACIGAIKS